MAFRAALRDALRESAARTPLRLFGSITHPYRFNECSDVDLALESEVPGISLCQLISLLSERLGRRVDLLLLSECRFREKIIAGRIVDATVMTILVRELEADAVVIRDAAGKAELRRRQESPGHLEACDYEIRQVLVPANQLHTPA